MRSVSKSSYCVSVAKYDFFQTREEVVFHSKLSSPLLVVLHCGMRAIGGFSAKYEDTVYQALCKYPHTRPSLL